MRAALYCLVACLLLARIAVCQTVGMLGDWEKIEFEGLKEVDADAIRAALAGDLEYQAAVRHSAAIVKFLKMTKTRITGGFRYSGYAKAKIKVRRDPEREWIVVQRTNNRRHFTSAAPIPRPAVAALWWNGFR